MILHYYVQLFTQSWYVDWGDRRLHHGDVSSKHQFHGVDYVTRLTVRAKQQQQ